MKKTKAALALAAMMAALALTACGGGSGTGSSTPVNVTLSDYKFDPGTVVLAQGKNTLVIKNTSGQTHDFTVKDLKIKVEVPAGKEITQVVTADKKGTFDLTCSQVGHADQNNMKGKVEVK